jgi:hypothetical protein
MNILFVCYGGGHVTMVLPVIRALRKQVPSAVITLIALTTAYPMAVAAGENPLGFMDLKHLADPAFADQWGARLSDGNRHPAVSEAETVAYIGVNFWDLVEQYGQDQAQALYRERGRHGFYPIHFFRRVIAHLRPDVVVATKSPRSEHAALEAAMDLGVATLSMVDLFAMNFDPYLKRQRQADCITVMRPQVQDNLIAAGIEPSRVVVTGNPAFDGLFDPVQRQAAREIRSALGWGKLKVVLWAGIIEHERSEKEDTQPGTAFGEKAERVLRAWCASREDVALFLRYHPNDAQRFAMMDPQPRVYVSQPLQDPLHPQILASDVVVVTGSTVGVETATASIPVLSLESSPSSILMSYAQLGISQGVARLSDLPESLDRVLFGPRSPSPVVQPGPAAPRIAREIERLAQRGCPWPM